MNATDLAEKLSDHPSVRTIQKDLVKLETASQVKREGKARAVLWVLIK